MAIHKSISVALIAHDAKKSEMIELVAKYKDIFSRCKLTATATTGRIIRETTGLEITSVESGPYGGDQQIGSLVATQQIDVVIFLRDPLSSQPHEPDISALLRLCDVHKIPLATNWNSAEIFLEHITRIQGTQ